MAKSQDCLFLPPRILISNFSISVFLAFLAVVFLQSVSCAEIIVRNYNSTEEAVLGDDDMLIIKSGPHNSFFTYQNYSGTGVVYFNPDDWSYLNVRIPDGYSNTKVFIAGYAFGLPTNSKSSDFYGVGRILVLTNEVPTIDGTTIVSEGTIWNCYYGNSGNGYTPTYDNDIQIKGVGGLRAGWHRTLSVSGKISDYTDASGTTPGKLIVEEDDGNFLILNGSNDYSGGTQIGGGQSNFPTGGPTTNAVQVDGTPYGIGPLSFGYAGSSVNLNGHSISLGGLDGSNNILGAINGSGTLTVDTGSDNYSTASTINGSVNLVKKGSGKQTLSGANTYTGTTTISEGTLELGADSTLYNLSGGSKNKPVTLDSGNNKLTINTAGNEAKLFVGSITASEITVNATDDAPFQIYTAANGLVNAESFVVSSGRVDVKGCMQAAVEVGSDATFSPGNSVGSVDIDGDFKLTGELLMEVDGTGADILTCDTFTMDGGKVVLNWQNDEIPFFSTLDIIIAESTTEDLSDVYNNLVENIDFSTSPTVEQLYNDGYIKVSLVGDNKIVRLSIDRNAVPEPSTWALLVLGVAGLLFWRKRK